jgi:hypothetical protein
MRFHLVYSGPLSASGNKSKLAEAAKIRVELHSQMQQLWQTHNALAVLKSEGARRDPKYPMMPGSPRKAARHQGITGYSDCLTYITVKDQPFFPLVRRSLDLTCELDILFLRQQDPGELISQGGDIDNRIKTLLDALRVPSPDEQERAPSIVPSEEAQGLHCLLESDTLVSRLNVDTDRLLSNKTEHPNEVHLVIEVTTNVLRVGSHNLCLL